jgi:hypothetical protein
MRLKSLEPMLLKLVLELTQSETNKITISLL